MKPSEFLTQAKELVERGWTKGVFARNADGYEVNFMIPSACQFCALGALRHVRYVPRATNTDYYITYDKAVGYLAKAIGTNDIQNIVIWNDKSDKETVLAAFRQAIDSAKQKEDIDEG